MGVLFCPAGPASGMSSLHALVSLAAALNNADADGRIVVDPAGQTLKFVLLKAAAHFVKARTCAGPDYRYHCHRNALHIAVKATTMCHLRTGCVCSACSGAGIGHTGARLLPAAAAVPWVAPAAAVPLQLWACGEQGPLYLPCSQMCSFQKHRPAAKIAEYRRCR